MGQPCGVWCDETSPENLQTGYSSCSRKEMQLPGWVLLGWRSKQSFNSSSSAVSSQHSLLQSLPLRQLAKQKSTSAAHHEAEDRDLGLVWSWESLNNWCICLVTITSLCFAPHLFQNTASAIFSRNAVSSSVCLVNTNFSTLSWVITPSRKPSFPPKSNSFEIDC